MGAVVLAASLPYLNNLGNGFVYDDRFVVENNPRVQTPDWKALVGEPYWGDLVAAGLYRPLTSLSFGLNRVLTGSDALGFHLVNNLLHAAASVVVFLSAEQMGAARLVATAAGLIFAVHPLHTEAVDSIVGRAEVLALFFALTALVFHMRTPYRGGAVFALVFLALASKESAFFALSLFVLYDGLVARSIRPRRYLPLAAATLAFALIRWQALGSGPGLGDRVIGRLDNPAAHAGWSTRWLTAPVLLGQYLLLLLAPVRLSADYSFDQIPLPTSPFDLRVLAGTAAAAGMVLGVMVAYRRRQFLLAFSLAALGAPLAGVLHVVFPLGTLFAERLAYLPSFGFCLSAAIAIDAIARRSRQAGALVLVAVLLTGSVRTFYRNRDWADNETLFRRTVEASPRSARSHFLLGTALMEKRDFTAAALSFSRGLAIAPGHPEAQVSLASAQRGLAHQLYTEGRLEEALSMLREAMRLDPTSEAANELGVLLGRQGRLGEAEIWHRRALELAPENALALNYLGVIEERRGNREAAITFYRKAVEQDGKLTPPLLNLGSCLMKEGDLAGAESCYRRAAALAPGSYEAQNSLGIVLARQGKREEAAAAFRRAIAVDPSQSAARENLRALESSAR